MLGRLYRGIVAKLFGVGPLVEENVAREIEARVPALVRAEIAAFLRTGTQPRTTLDVEQAAYFLASVASAQYFLERMRMAENLVRSDALLQFAMERCTVDGLIMEFGVYRGDSLRVIAANTTAPVYGFDSFQGLPEDWTHYQKKGRFSLEGKLPRFEQPNVELVPGWFEETLPAFLSRHPGPARFVHVDSDVYGSARTVLNQLTPRIVPGTVIVFDEYFNYPGWEQHEFRAFQEFVAGTGCTYRYLGFASSQQAVAVQIA
jgi:hypothetical protein